MAIEWITSAEAGPGRGAEQRVLLEQDPEHYPEFMVTLKRHMEGVDGDLYFRGVSGSVYRVGVVEEDPDGLNGVEVCVIAAEFNAPPVRDETIDRDLWPFLEWIIETAGGEWTVDALRKTGAIYQAPGAPERA